MLRSTKRQCVHAHLRGAQPFAPARVVADAADLEYTSREVAHGVAADDERITGPFANGAIEIVDDFGRGSRWSGGERPTVARHRAAHLKAPATENVEGGVIMLDQLIAPLAEPAQIDDHLLANAVDRGIENVAIARESPGVRRRRRSEEGANPNPGPRTGAANAFADRRHVAELFIAMIPRAHAGLCLAAVRLPA